MDEHHYEVEVDMKDGSRTTWSYGPFKTAQDAMRCETLAYVRKKLPGARRLVPVRVSRRDVDVSDPTLPLELNMEDSGHLVHLLVRELGPYMLGERKPQNNTEAVVLGRRMGLYERLASLNDKLMGKTNG